MSAERRCYIDGIDIWLAFGMFVMDGTNDFLKLPERKEPMSYEWADANGTDVDLSRVFFKSRDITIKFGFKTNNLDDFWLKSIQFAGLLSKPGTRRIEIVEFQRSYYVYYKDTVNYKRYKKVNGDSIIEFSVLFNEPNPQIDSSMTYIIDEMGRFLCT